MSRNSTEKVSRTPGTVQCICHMEFVVYTGIWRKGKQRLCLELVPYKMADSIGVDAAQGYKECLVPFQKVEGEKFIQMDVSPQMQAGDAILDLGCGTGQRSAYLANLVGPEGKVVAVDLDKERILLAQQSYGDVKNLSFLDHGRKRFKLSRDWIGIIRHYIQQLCHPLGP